jgi:hypothetical protein
MLVYLLAAYIGVFVLGGSDARPEAGSGSLEYLTWQTEHHIAYVIRKSDTAKVMLLDRQVVGPGEDWREKYNSLILDWPVRTTQLKVQSADVEKLKSLFLDDQSYIHGDVKQCLTEGDAAIVFRGQYGEATVMLELWCGTVHFRGAWGYTLTRYADPIDCELINIVEKYFPEDSYLKHLSETR